MLKQNLIFSRIRDCFVRRAINWRPQRPDAGRLPHRLGDLLQEPAHRAAQGVARQQGRRHPRQGATGCHTCRPANYRSAREIQNSKRNIRK